MSDENFERYEEQNQEEKPVQHIPSYKIILCAEVPAEKRDLPHVFSIECGLNDGKRHFDHHGPHSANLCPANNPHIVWYWDGEYECDAEIYISHIDADTFIGVSRLVGNGWSKKEFTWFDYSIIEKVDTNGSSVLSGEKKMPAEYLFMVGLGEAFRFLKFPRCTKDPVDVTSYFQKFDYFCEFSTFVYEERELYVYTLGRVLDIGHDTLEKIEETYLRCVKILDAENKTGMWSVGAEDPFDPSMPYTKGIKLVGVYRKHYKTMSLYADPTLSIDLRGAYAGIEFAGHAKACGTPRGMEITEDQAKEIFLNVEKFWAGKI